MSSSSLPRMLEVKGDERSAPSDDDLTVIDGDRTRETTTRDDAEKSGIENAPQPQVKWTWVKVFLVATTTCSMILNVRVGMRDQDGAIIREQ